MIKKILKMHIKLFFWFMNKYVFLGDKQAQNYDTFVF